MTDKFYSKAAGVWIDLDEMLDNAGIPVAVSEGGRVAGISTYDEYTPDLEPGTTAMKKAFADYLLNGPVPVYQGVNTLCASCGQPATGAGASWSWNHRGHEYLYCSDKCRRDAR